MKINKEARIELISKVLSERGYVSTLELCDITGATPVTIRNDLTEMESCGSLIRSYGGAFLQQETAAANAPLNYQFDGINNYELKKRVAAKAFEQLDGDEDIFVGAGSSLYVFALELERAPNIRVVTNNLNVANTLTLRKDHLYYIGGQIIVSNGVYHTTSTTIASELKKIYIKKAFIGVSGISVNSGFTINNAYQVDLYRSVMEIAEDVTILCDHTKFGLQRMYRLTIAKNVKTLITTGTVPDVYMRKFAEMGLKVICA